MQLISCIQALLDELPEACRRITSAADYVAISEAISILKALVFRMAAHVLQWMLRDIEALENRMTKLIVADKGSGSVSHIMRHLEGKRDNLLLRAKRIRTLGL